MLRSLATLALLASSTWAFPALIQRRDDPNTGLTWIYKDETLPKVMLYNTAFYATETNGNTVSTFLSSYQGYIAQFMSGQPYFFFGASLPKARHYFIPFNLISPLTKVVVLYGHQGFDASLLYSAADNGASISSGFLRGEIARIQLQLALGAGYDFLGIQKLFEGDVRRALYNEAAPFYNGTVW